MAIRAPDGAKKMVMLMRRCLDFIEMWMMIKEMMTNEAGDR